MFSIKIINSISLIFIFCIFPKKHITILIHYIVIFPINIDPEILIVDEALSVGDVFFQAKCYHKFEEFKKQGKTIILISHNLFQVYDISDRICVIKNGRQVDFFLTRDSSPEQLYQSIIEREEQADDEKMDE